jgi:peptidoglycan hydrolase-like protein with peptidoglycan-binding domain
LPLINIQKALAAYGYGIEATGAYDEQSRNVVRAFQLHFQPYEVTREMSRASTAFLCALLDKYYPEELDELLEAPLDSATAIENELAEDAADSPVSEPEMTQ